MKILVYALAILLIVCMALIIRVYWLYTASLNTIANLREDVTIATIQTFAAQDQLNEYTDALERIRADAETQAARVSKAQADAAKERAQSESRVQAILTRPNTDDTRELVEWAVAEAQRLNVALEAE